MNLLKAAEFKVGLLVIAVASLIAYMSMRVSDDPSFLRRSNEAWFLLNDAGGLVKNSAIRSAGIPVGIIKDITLQDGIARVEITVKSDFKLFESAVAEIKSQGILGDKHVQIYPGSPTDPPLPDGGQIINVKDQGSLDSVISQVGEIAGSLKETAKNLQEAVNGNGTREHVLGRIVLNIEKLTQNISEITGDNKQKINEIVDQVHDITESLSDMLNENDPDSVKAQIKRTMGRLDNAMKNVDEISGKINRGEGTIGRLVNDEETVEELNTAIEGVNGFLDTAGKLQTGLDFHSEYLGNVGSAKTTIGLKIQPGLDRFYYIGVVDDPAGLVEKTKTKSTQANVTTETDYEKTYYSKVKFSLLYAKNFYNWTVKGGLIENSGGVGLDYNFFEDKMRFTVEAFEFTKLNLRAQLQYNVWRGIYLNVGASDILNRGDKYSGYLGAGLLLTNDDLKMLLTKIPL